MFTIEFNFARVFMTSDGRFQEGEPAIETPPMELNILEPVQEEAIGQIAETGSEETLPIVRIQEADDENARTWEREAQPEAEFLNRANFERVDLLHELEEIFLRMWERERWPDVPDWFQAQIEWAMTEESKC
jgi:hypothetical protein